jgi:hypothetical protein
MRKTCVQPVEMLWPGGGPEHIMCTRHRPHVAGVRVQPSFYAQFTPNPSPGFPHAIMTTFTPLTNLLSPQSTVPITMTTKYIIN